MPKQLKWNSKGKEGLYLTNLFIDNKVDLNNLKPDYIRSVKAAHKIFEPFSDERFVINYRKLHSDFQIGKAKTGARQEGKLLKNF